MYESAVMVVRGHVNGRSWLRRPLRGRLANGLRSRVVRVKGLRADARYARSRVALLGASAGAPLRGASLARLRSFSRSLRSARRRCACAPRASLRGYAPSVAPSLRWRPCRALPPLLPPWVVGSVGLSPRLADPCSVAPLVGLAPSRIVGAPFV